MGWGRKKKVEREKVKNVDVLYLSVVNKERRTKELLCSSTVIICISNQIDMSVDQLISLEYQFVKKGCPDVNIASMLFFFLISNNVTN